jgi:hypothetical protein
LGIASPDKIRLITNDGSGKVYADRILEVLVRDDEAIPGKLIYTSNVGEA